MRLILFICFFATAAVAQMPPIEPGVSQELAKWRAAQYSNISYKLNLTLEKMSPVLKGTIEIRVSVSPLRRGITGPGGLSVSEPGAVATGFLPPIILDWRRIKGFEGHSQISNFSINGRRAVGLETNSHYLPGDENELTYLDEYEHLVISDGVVAGENVIKLDFTSPILTSGSAITRYVDKEDGAEYIYSLFVPSDASTAFPVFDQPDLKARFELTLTLPADWKSISNAPLESDEQRICVNCGSKADYTEHRHHYRQTGRISTYVFAFAAGPFIALGDAQSGTTYIKKWPEGLTINPLSPAEKKELNEQLTSSTYLDTVPSSPNFTTVYVRKSQAAKFKPHAAEVFRLNREGIKYLEIYFDYKFPFPKYDLVLIPEFPFGGMEHAGATFLREDRVIFPAEPTANDYITRANLIFHEAAHQWFGDCVTMRWFDDLWLKEGFAEFMAYKTLEKVMPEYNAWKAFYERNKQAAYATDSTRGTTPIYQEIKNLSAAKSAYGNIVYRKAPSFLRQAEFYLGEDKFQTAARAFLKKHEFGNAGWEDLVWEFETASGKDLKEWANLWVTRRGVPQIKFSFVSGAKTKGDEIIRIEQTGLIENVLREQDFLSLLVVAKAKREKWRFGTYAKSPIFQRRSTIYLEGDVVLAFPNYQDYGYGIFLLDKESRDYVLKNIQNEKDPFLRSMMWGALWDSVREAVLDPREYVELVIKNLSIVWSSGRKAAKPAAEQDETIIQSVLSRTGTAMNYYVHDRNKNGLQERLEDTLIEQMTAATTGGQRITYYRAFLNLASTDKGRLALNNIIEANLGASPEQLAAAGKDAGKSYKTIEFRGIPVLRTKDKFDVITRLISLGDPDAPKFLADLEKTETSDDAKRYAYAAHSAFGTAENKAKFFNDFLNNKDISESWIESAIVPFNSIRHADLTQQYLTRALAELPNLKRTRKIFFINNWLAAFIGGQRNEKALAAINKFLADNPNLDNDLRLKILENADLIERAVKIRTKYRN